MILQLLGMPRFTVRFIAPFAALVVVVALVTRVNATGMMGMESGDLRISTDSTDYDIGSGDFTMPHHVTASRPGTTIDGDHARGNGKRKQVTLDGHVIVVDTGGGDGATSFGVSGKKEPSTLKTDRLTIQLGTKQYTAEGHVHFVQGKRIATADTATLDDRTHELQLAGNVHLEDDGQILDAATLHYNTASEKVHADTNVRIIIPLATPAPPAPVIRPMATIVPPAVSAHHGRH